MTREEIIKSLPKSILEDIRAEIDGYCSDNRDRNDGLYIAMRIIDKYEERGGCGSMTIEEAKEYIYECLDYSEATEVVKAFEQEPCEDCISRQAAIDCLNADFTIDGKENMETVVDYINGAFKQIKALPSVTPKPKMGQWIYDKTIENWRCSECNKTPKIMRYVGTADFMAEHFRFCNYCGIKMKVSENNHRR